MTTAALYHLIRIVAALRRLLRREHVLSREAKARMKQELMSEHVQTYKTVHVEWYWLQSTGWQKGERDE
jgi:hypothetical protein